jgi:hypothetical protein
MRRSTPVRIIGLPGDGALRHIRINKGDVLTVCRDADISNPAADKAIADGLDSLLLQAGHVPDWATTPNQTSIFVTRTEGHAKDANQALIDSGVDGLDALLADVERATLSSPGGVVVWLAGLDRVDLDLEIKRASRATGLRIPTLRAEVADWRKRSGDHSPDEPEPVLPDEDVDIGATLDALLTELQNYIVAPVTTLGTVALWAVFTHLVHNDRLMVQVAPRLGVQARTPGCGKTLLLELLNCIVHNARAAVSITASTVLRTFGAVKPTMLVDEAHRLLRAHEKTELIAMMNCGHYRWNAFVERSVQRPNGEWVVERFPVWGTMALASIGELPQDQQERAIVINLRKVLAKDVPARLRHGSSTELQRLQKAIAGWAAAVDELPEVEVPAALEYQPGRIFDNWEPLLQIAALAGGRWPELIQNAIADTVKAEREPAPVERVLSGIKRAFGTVSERADKDLDRLTTADLIAEMINDPNEEWSTEYRGRSITPYWLRGALRNLLDPPGAQNWWTPEDRPRKEQKCVSGYFRAQFTRAWEVYLDNGAGAAADKDDVRGASESSATSATSSTSATDGGNAGLSGGWLCGRSEYTDPIGNKGCGRSEDTLREERILHTEKPEETCGPVADGAYVADVADLSETLHTYPLGSPQPQLDGEERPRPRRTFAQDVRDYAAANQDLTAARIAKHFGCPRQRVNRALGRDDKSP